MPARSLNVSAKASAPASSSLTIANMPAMKVVRKVTVPTLRQTTDGSIVAFTVKGPMEISKKDIKQADGSTPNQRATIMAVIDLMSGNDAMYVVPAILKSQLEDDYPENGYVNKSFAVQKLPKRDGKRYRDLNVVEIDGDDFAEQRRAQIAAENAAE